MKQRYKCPCCGYLTLFELFEICSMCNWEDDGQDDSHAEERWGGPNGDYTLSEARANFKRHLHMYREPIEDKYEYSLKKLLIQKHHIYIENNEMALWEQIIDVKTKLDNLIGEKITKYEKDIENRRKNGYEGDSEDIG
ncbi:CPCC family cysteine-rich protein [Paenibacillus sp. FSL H8-0104]|uniref:CPCC family cysteine-rich protein n=1 Tax=Paenibacillus sp. FSL H8-0104 TaxID=2954509 RepID=UPI0030FD73B6